MATASTSSGTLPAGHASAAGGRPPVAGTWPASAVAGALWCAAGAGVLALGRPGGRAGAVLGDHPGLPLLAGAWTLTNGAGYLFRAFAIFELDRARG
jgi:hypothetical protein